MSFGSERGFRSFEAPVAAGSWRMPSLRVLAKGATRGAVYVGTTAVVSISTLARSSISALTSTTAIAG